MCFQTFVSQVNALLGLLHIFGNRKVRVTPWTPLMIKKGTSPCTPTLLLLLRGNIPSLNGNGHYKSRCLFIHSGKFNIAMGSDWVDVFPIKHVMFQPAIFIYQRVMSLWISYFKMQDSQPRIRLQVGSVEASFHWRSGSIEYKDFLPGTTGALGWAGTLYIVGETHLWESFM